MAVKVKKRALPHGNSLTQLKYINGRVFFFFFFINQYVLKLTTYRLWCKFLGAIGLFGTERDWSNIFTQGANQSCPIIGLSMQFSLLKLEFLENSTGNSFYQKGSAKFQIKGLVLLSGQYKLFKKLVSCFKQLMNDYQCTENLVGLFWTKFL